MKTLITLLLISICSMAFGQKKDITASSKGITVVDDVRLNQLGLDVNVIPFDALNGAIIQESENANKYAHKADSAKWEVVRRILQIKGIDFSRISDKGDSLRITPDGIFLKLKPKKK